MEPVERGYDHVAALSSCHPLPLPLDAAKNTIQTNTNTSVNSKTNTWALDCPQLQCMRVELMFLLHLELPVNSVSIFRSLEI